MYAAQADDNVDTQQEMDTIKGAQEAENTSVLESQGQESVPNATNIEKEDSSEQKTLDPFMVYQEDIFVFNDELAKKANFSVKTCGKFRKKGP